MQSGFFSSSFDKLSKSSGSFKSSEAFQSDCLQVPEYLKYTGKTLYSLKQNKTKKQAGLSRATLEISSEFSYNSPLISQK